MLTHDQRAFLQKFWRDPGPIGALSPATDQLALAIAKATQRVYVEAPGTGANQIEPLCMFELGAGTGALTRVIANMNPVLVERDAAWAALLRRRFPDLEVRTECASRTLAELVKPVGIVTSIPLLNNPQSSELKRLLSQRYAEGLIRFCVLYSYGWGDPLKGTGFRKPRRHALVARNLPPAWVWTYE